MYEGNVSVAERLVFGVIVAAIVVSGLIVSASPLWIMSTAVVTALVLGRLSVLHRGRRHDLANRDDLTGLANRTRFERDVERRKRGGGATAVLMIDIDHLSEIEAVHGQTRSDEVLRDVGAILKSAFRHGDTSYRYGATGFSVLLPQTSPADAMHAGERARRSIAELASLDGGVVTASVGVGLTPASRVGEAIETADQALLNAKDNGRNRVEFLVPTVF